jgi:iron(III) transport system ATP-binding protein
MTRSKNTSGLSVQNLTKRYNGVLAVDDVSFDVKPGEFLSLLGPSGCGKTTTLRSIAGFERPDSGRILLDSQPITDPQAGIFVPPNKRHFGMVFQSYAVWPHMTVLENVAYPLKVRGGIPRASQQERAVEQLKIVGLAGYERRYPNELSGGQQQRVALARALVMEPRVLLFDEPLSNLDAKLRERMRFELIEIQSKLGISAVYVTHDQAEAMVMSARVIVMDRGKIAQEGPPKEIYAAPRTRFVADFIGLSIFIDAEILDQDKTVWRARTALGDLLCVSDQDHVPGEKVVVAIRPERVQIGKAQCGEANAFRGVLQNAYFIGPYTEYFVEVVGVVIRVQAPSPLDVLIGDEVFVGVTPSNCRIVSASHAPGTSPDEHLSPSIQDSL